MTEENLASDLLRGVPQIGRFIGESDRRTYYLAETKKIPVFKMGKLWMARKSTLRRHYENLEASHA